MNQYPTTEEIAKAQRWWASLPNKFKSEWSIWEILALYHIDANAPFEMQRQ